MLLKNFQKKSLPLEICWLKVKIFVKMHFTLLLFKLLNINQTIYFVNFPTNFGLFFQIYDYLYRELCGDLIVSGHTISLFMAALALKQYSPEKLYCLAQLCYCATFIAVPCILLARKHYTIDVILAYYLTTRIFWTYHSLSVLSY